MWLSQERDACGELRGFGNFTINFIFVRNISIKNKRSSIERCLKSALSWSHSWTIFRPVLDWHCLNSLSCNWLGWSILSEEFRVSHGRVIESDVIVHWPVEVLPVGNMSFAVILGALDIEIRNPAQLSINVSIFGNVRVIWHSCSLDLVHLIWVVLSPWLQKNWLLWLELLIEVLSVVSMIVLVKVGWSTVETFVPLVISWSKHTIISVFLHDQFSCGLSICWISTTELSMGFEDVCESFSSKRWLSIVRSNWGSQLWVNYNVFSVWHIFLLI